MFKNQPSVFDKPRVIRQSWWYKQMQQPTGQPSAPEPTPQPTERPDAPATDAAGNCFSDADPNL
jgi:hypothetical protein